MSYAEQISGLEYCRKDLPPKEDKGQVRIIYKDCQYPVDIPYSYCSPVIPCARFRVRRLTRLGWCQ